MKIDSAIEEFLERYDSDAIASIDEMSRQLGRITRKDTINLFNINESFNSFNMWLRGYSDFHLSESELPSIGEITESYQAFLGNDEMFKETALTYDKFPGFVKAYVEGIQKTIGNVDQLKTTMLEAGIDGERIGAINEFTDLFMDKMTKSFNESMNNLLRASGYNSRQVLFGKKPSAKKPVFL